MIALVGMPFTNVLETATIGFFPAITTAFAWWFLFNQQQKLEVEQTAIL
jgi:hypothetical protein